MLSSLSENDKLTLSLSLLALVMSIVAVVVGQIQQNRQLRNATRDQLVEIVGKLIDARQELSIAEGDFNCLQRPTPQDIGRFDVLAESLNHKLTSLAREASAVMEVKGVSCFDVELIAIANALATAGDIEGAERLYRLAVEKASNPFFRSLNLSLLADHLMRINDVETARRVYAESVAVLPNDTDHHRAANCSIYQAWMIAEMNAAAPPNPRVMECLARAKRIAGEIGFEPVRQARLTELEERVRDYSARFGAVAPALRGAS